VCYLGWPEGIEPSYVRVTVVSVNRFTMATTALCQKPALAGFYKYGGAEQDRTVDLLTASQALSQLSYSPTQTIKNRILFTHKPTPRKVLTI
jgi:hypothetical protein